MSTNLEETTVAIIGGGVSCLTLAIFSSFPASRASCWSGVIAPALSRPANELVWLRRAECAYRAMDLADRLLGDPIAQMIGYRLNDKGRIFQIVADDGSEGRFCTQQTLVDNLLREFIDTMASDVRFEIKVVVIQNEEDKRLMVYYTDAKGSHEIAYDHIVGCDGSRGASRSSIPYGVITETTHEYG